MPVTEIPTDLLTPLGAYLTLREGTGGSFLLESVERGRLGRFSFVGAGTRLVSFAEAELPIFVISTFESDYVLVRSSDLGRAADILEDAGHVFAA